jgi:hypothetical protein
MYSSNRQQLGSEYSTSKTAANCTCLVDLRDSIAPMKKRRYPLFIVLLVICAGVIFGATPSRLSDSEFWKLATESSEEDGYFRSDNLLSNETTFQYVIPKVLSIAKPGRVYLGVGPEQNFTYIAALKPSMAFIVDIRHGNFDVQLLYKALFELSKDRVDFAFRLFSRTRPDELKSNASVRELMGALQASNGNRNVYEENLKTIQDQLTKKHNFPLTDGDREGITWALSNYYKFGPGINYGSSLSAGVPPEVVGVSNGRGGVNGATYESLMTADDGDNKNRSYLATEENFQIMKDLESRNLIVPVVGDFGGTKALRAVAKYLHSVDGKVSAFYVSNVEQFLQGSLWDNFCRSVRSMPIDETSMFIRSGRGNPYTVNSTGGNVQNSSAAVMQPELMCTEAAR